MSKNEKTFTECIKLVTVTVRPWDFHAHCKNETVMVLNRFPRNNGVFRMVFDGFLVIFKSFQSFIKFTYFTVFIGFFTVFIGFLTVL